MKCRPCHRVFEDIRVPPAALKYNPVRGPEKHSSVPVEVEALVEPAAVEGDDVAEAGSPGTAGLPCDESKLLGAVRLAVLPRSPQFLERVV